MCKEPGAASPISAAILLVAAGLMGTSGWFIRMADLPAETIALFRMGVPTVLIGGWFLARRQMPARSGLRNRMIASTINAVRMYFYFLAFRYTTVANAVVAVYSWPIFAAFFGRLILRERVSKRDATLLGLAFLGIPILYFPNEIEGASLSYKDGLGITAMVFSAALHALAIVLLKGSQRRSTAVETTFFQNGVGALAFGLILLLQRPSIQPHQFAAGIGLGLITGTVAFSLFFLALQNLKTARASNLAYFEVLVGVAIGTLILSEPLRWNTLVGGVLISVSVMLSRSTGERVRRRRAAG